MTGTLSSQVADALHQVLEATTPASRSARLQLIRHVVDIESQSVGIVMPNSAASANALHSTAQAAALLGYSRPYVAMLIDQNKLKGATVSTSRRNRYLCTDCTANFQRESSADGYGKLQARICVDSSPKVSRQCPINKKHLAGAAPSALFYGVADGTRTRDNWNHNPGLYQLSYSHRRTKRLGAPDRTRTCNRRLRRPVLYPVELRALRRAPRRPLGADGAFVVGRGGEI